DGLQAEVGEPGTPVDLEVHTGEAGVTLVAVGDVGLHRATVSCITMYHATLRAVGIQGQQTLAPQLGDVLRSDDVLDLDRVPVDGHAQVVSPYVVEGRLQHQTSGPGIGGFRLDVAVAEQHHGIGARGGLLARTSRLVRYVAAVVEVPLAGSRHQLAAELYDCSTVGRIGVAGASTVV